MMRFAVIIFLVLSAPLCAKEPRVVAADIAPFVFIEKGQAQGIAYDIGREVMNRLAYAGQIEIQPLARAQHTVQTGKNVISVWLGRIPEREATVQWISLVLKDSFSIYSLPGKPVAGSLVLARQIGTLGANIGAANAIEAKKHGLTQIELISSDEANVKKLIAGRIAGWITLQVSADFYIARYPIPGNTLARGVKLGDYQAWIVASPSVDQQTMSQWQRALIAMRKDGTLSRIYAKYGIKMPDS